jgi:hypothetical protein
MSRSLRIPWDDSTGSRKDSFEGYPHTPALRDCLGEEWLLRATPTPRPAGHARPRFGPGRGIVRGHPQAPGPDVGRTRPPNPPMLGGSGESRRFHPSIGGARGGRLAMPPLLGPRQGEQGRAACLRRSAGARHNFACPQPSAVRDGRTHPLCSRPARPAERPGAILADRLWCEPCGSDLLGARSRAGRRRTPGSARAGGSRRVGPEQPERFEGPPRAPRAAS